MPLFDFIWDQNRVLGIDEAGRGSIIGPLVIGGVVANAAIIKQFEQDSIKDSKQLSPSQRKIMKKSIETNAIQVVTKALSPALIDEVLQDKSDNLNLLEIRTMAEIIIENPSGTIIIDAVGNSVYFVTEIKKILEKNSKINKVQVNLPDKLLISWNTKILKITDKSTTISSILIAQNKADENFPIVSAASIIAKTERDNTIKILETSFSLKGKLASGYPNEHLIPFMRRYQNKIKNKEFPFIRYSWNWEPLQKLLKKRFKQKKIFN